MAIGLSVHTAPVEIREKLAIAEAHWPEAIAQLCAFPHVEEAAVLSTCNRMEIYCVVLSYNRGVREVEEFLSKVRALHPTCHLAPWAAPRWRGRGHTAPRSVATTRAGCDAARVGSQQARLSGPFSFRLGLGVVTSPDPPRHGPATPG